METKEIIGRIKEIVGSLDNDIAKNRLHQEMPILSLFTHGAYDRHEYNIEKNMVETFANLLSNEMTDKFSRIKHELEIRNEIIKKSKIKVDIIMISSIDIGDPVNEYDEQFMIEYNKIIQQLKYISVLNDTLQKKQLEIVARDLRNGYKKLIERVINRRKKLISINKEIVHQINQGLWQFNNDDKEQYVDTIKISREKIKYYQNVLKKLHTSFQIYHLKKGDKTYKNLQMELNYKDGGIFEINSPEDLFNTYYMDTKIEMDDDYKFIDIYLDNFINYYYDNCEHKPKKIIIIDNACSDIINENYTSLKNNQKKEFKNGFNKLLKRQKRSFNINPIERNTRSLNRTQRFNLNSKKSLKHKYKEIMDTKKN